MTSTDNRKNNNIILWESMMYLLNISYHILFDGGQKFREKYFVVRWIEFEIARIFQNHYLDDVMVVLITL